MNNSLFYFQNTNQKFSFSLAAMILYLVIFLSLAGRVFAAGGGVDPTFKTGATNFTNESVEAVAVQSDGRILIGGNFEVVGGERRVRIARLNADGSVDTSFNPPSGANNSVQAIAVQTDGRIFVGGIFTAFNGASNRYLVRLNADGTTDSTFHPIDFNAQIEAVILQPGGKILVGGSFVLPNAMRIARLNFDGSLDTEFAANTGTGANFAISALALQADGKILLGGSFTSINGATMNRLARLNQNGTPDTGFNVGTGANSAINTIAVQSNGKIIIGGAFSTFNGVIKGYLTRLNADGALDASFNGGTGANSPVYEVKIQADDKILVGGNFTTFNGQARKSIVRINENGALDASFAPPNPSNFVKAVQQQVTGEVIVGGNFSTVGNTPRTAVAQFDFFGNLDASFATVVGDTGDVSALKIQPDGKIVVGGAFIGINDKFRNRVARLNADGTLDETFNPGAGANANVTEVVVQPDGKIIIGGAFSMYNGVTRNRLARLNADGALDTTFTASLSGTPDKIVVQTNGKILVAGNIPAVNNDSTRKYLVRLNADGSIDTGFAVNAYGSIVNSVGVQSNGKIVIAGSFTTINGAAANHIARLNADGTVDASFAASADGIPQVLTVTGEDKIAFGGNFAQVNGANRSRFARLNADGTLDANFTVGTGASATVETIVEQADGKLLIGGAFTQYNSFNRGRIARVNSDGSLDVSFNPGTGADGTVKTIAVASDGRILVGGIFSAINNFSSIALARLLAGGTSVWTGAADANYENPLNWTDNLVPTNSDSAEISGNVSNQPVLNSAANLTNLQINQNASLTINSGARLNLQGLGNSGTLQGAGILDLSGASFVNNGVISVSTVNFAGGGDSKSLGGAGAFSGNVVNIGANVRLRLENNHTFNKISFATGAAFDVSSRVVRLTAAGEALSGNGGINTNFSTVVYAGNEPQAISATQFFNLIVENPSNVALGRSTTILGTLDLKSGILSTGANTLAFSTAANATRTSGYVIGKIQKSLIAGQNFTFPVGTANGYAPVTVSNVDRTANFTAQANNGFLAGIDQAQTLSMNWTLTASNNMQADLTLQYPQQSVPATANEANLKFVRRANAVNSEFAPTLTDANSNTFTLNNVSEFSDWTLGRNLAPTAAPIEIGGRVWSGKRGVAGINITLTNVRGQTHSILTDDFGFYRFSELTAGETYIVAVSSKSYAFSNPRRVLFASEDLTDVDFYGVPKKKQHQNSHIAEFTNN